VEPYILCPIHHRDVVLRHKTYAIFTFCMRMAPRFVCYSFNDPVSTTVVKHGLFLRGKNMQLLEIKNRRKIFGPK
jgi:hypothetical protein